VLAVALVDAPSAAPEAPQRATTGRGRALALLVGLGLLVLGLVVSLSAGSNRIPLEVVWSVLVHPDASEASGVVHDLRVPRTAMAVVVGAALALAGAVMQAMTRNPLADPGILGINAGATLTVVVAVALTGTSGVHFYLWFAILGAAVAAVGVYVLGGTGRSSQTPVRLALAGVAVSAALTAITQTVILADQEAFNEFRFWVAGSFEGRTWEVLATVLPLIVAGVLIAVLVSPALDVLGLGEEAARGLGVDINRVRWLSITCVALLAGAATAAVGPIGFVGLAVPLLARRLVGHDQRRIVVLCLLLGPAWLLLADSAARVVLAPQEVPVGAVAALVGAPVFVALCARRKVTTL
jgi:iron complex transport system permease protein